jgi:hypothetical protein
MSASLSVMIDIRSFTLAIVSVPVISVASHAQVLEHKRPTEELIKQCEKFSAEGGLLTPDGWARGSKFFATSDPYPENSDIDIISRPGLIGEDHVEGDHAVVRTKWGDYHGTIDSQLRFKAEPFGSVMLGEEFSLVLVAQGYARKNAQSGNDFGGWRIERTPKKRSANILSAIHYLQKMKDIG